MAEHEGQVHPEYPNREQLQKCLQLLFEVPDDTAPLLLCPTRAWADSFRKYLQEKLRPMLAPPHKP